MKTRRLQWFGTSRTDVGEKNQRENEEEGDRDEDEERLYWKI